MFFSIALLFIVQQSAAQNKFTISGYIKDSLTGETLIGATLQAGGKGKGVNSNAYGFYSITLDAGDYDLTASFVGYQGRQLPLHLTSNQTYNFLLPPKAAASEEVVVYAQTPR